VPGYLENPKYRFIFSGADARRIFGAESNSDDRGIMELNACVCRDTNVSLITKLMILTTPTPQKSVYRDHKDGSRDMNRQAPTTENLQQSSRIPVGVFRSPFTIDKSRSTSDNILHIRIQSTSDSQGTAKIRLDEPEYNALNLI